MLNLTEGHYVIFHRVIIRKIKNLVNLKMSPGILLVLAIGLVPQLSFAEELVGRLSYHWSPTHTSAVYAEMFAAEVNKRAKGRLRIDTYPNKQLFGIREVMGALTAGSVELGAVIGIVGFPSVVKDFNIASFPGMWASFEHQRKFFSEDPEGQKLWNAVLDKTKTKLVMYDPVGPVLSCSTKSPMDTVASYEGLKARRLFGTEKPLWKALKVDYQKLGTRDVYTALQTGMVDTVNTVPNGLKAYSWWEFLKYCQIPYQSYADAYVMANANWLENLPADLRQIMMDVGKEIGAKASANIMNASAGILEEFKSHGGTVTVRQGAAKAEFDQLLADKVFPALSDMVSADLLKAAQAFPAN
jgi:TRAP-type C4-dicarboxylate transport system substrate-binding protein